MGAVWLCWFRVSRRSLLGCLAREFRDAPCGLSGSGIPVFRDAPWWAVWHLSFKTLLAGCLARKFEAGLIDEGERIKVQVVSTQQVLSTEAVVSKCRPYRRSRSYQRRSLWAVGLGCFRVSRRSMVGCLAHELRDAPCVLSGSAIRIDESCRKSAARIDEAGRTEVQLVSTNAVVRCSSHRQRRS